MSLHMSLHPEKMHKLHLSMLQILFTKFSGPVILQYILIFASYVYF